MSCLLPNGLKRPVLDVDSENLIFLQNFPNNQPLNDIRKDIFRRYGHVRFVETFEAWTKRKIGQIIMEFDSRNNMDRFAEALSRKEILGNCRPPIEHRCFNPKLGKKEFFDYVKEFSGVDLLACRAIPSNFNWKSAFPNKNNRGGEFPLRPASAFGRTVSTNGRTSDNERAPQRASIFSRITTAKSSNNDRVDNNENNNGGIYENGGGFGMRRGSLERNGERGGGVLRGRGGRGGDPRVGTISAASATFERRPPENIGKNNNRMTTATLWEQEEIDAEEKSGSSESVAVANGKGGNGGGGFLNGAKLEEGSHLSSSETLIEKEVEEFEHADEKNGSTESLIELAEGDEKKNDSTSESAEASENGADEEKNEEEAVFDNSFKPVSPQFGKYRSKAPSIASEEDDAEKRNTLLIRGIKDGFSLEKILEALQNFGDIIEDKQLDENTAMFKFLDSSEAELAAKVAAKDLFMFGSDAVFELQP